MIGGVVMNERECVMVMNEKSMCDGDVMVMNEGECDERSECVMMMNQGECDGTLINEGECGD